MNISSKILNVATSQIVGSSPKKMIIERIILEAKRLLFQTNHSTKEISFLLGFEEPTNFNKFFKKHTYITPIKFKEGLFK
jgi:AraC-like DNA-binding protein